MDIVSAFRAYYERHAVGRLDIVSALRMIFVDKGYHILFDWERLRRYLWDLAPAEEPFRARFALLFESGAIDHIKNATLDAYRYKEHFERAEKALLKAGLTSTLAKETVFAMYDALGFPVDTSRLEKTELVGEDTYYLGQTKDGLPHGRGHQEFSIEGDVYDSRDGQWINGKLCGFLHSWVGATENYCFCIDDGHVIGKSTVINEDGGIYVHEYEV